MQLAQAVVAIVRRGKSGAMTKITTGVVIMAKRVLTGIVVSHQIPLAEFVYDEQGATATWRIWLNYDRGREYGTYITLCDDGSIIRETVDESGERCRCGTITPADKFR